MTCKIRSVVAVSGKKNELVKSLKNQASFNFFIAHFKVTIILSSPKF